MKILVRSPQTVAEQFLAYPFYTLLRERFPEAKITVACPPALRNLQFKTCVDQILTLPLLGEDPSVLTRWKALNDSASQVSREVYDLGFVLPGSLSAAYWMKRAGVRRRVGWAGEGRFFFLTDQVAEGQLDSRHRSDHYLKLLAGALRERERGVPESSRFWSSLPEHPLDPRLPGWKNHFDPSQEWPHRRSLENVVREIGGASYVVIAPWGECETQGWPVLAVRDLIRRFLDETTHRVVVVGVSQDIAQASEVTAGWDERVIDAVSKGDLQDYSDFLVNAELLVTADSVWGHLGALCSRVTQLVWGGADPARVRPLGPGRVQLAVQPVECWPCSRRVCLQSGSARLACIRETSVQLVWEEIQRGLEYTHARNSTSA